MTEFTSKWLTWEPPETLKGGTVKTAKSQSATLETLGVRTDNTVKRASVSFGSSHPTHSQGNVAALGESTDEGPDCANEPIRPIDTLCEQARRTTPETPRARTDKTDRRWDRETAELIEWFLGTEPPTGPFRLQQAVYVAHPAHYWEYLKSDVKAGPNRARGKTGASQENLRQLYRVFHDGNDIGGGTT